MIINVLKLHLLIAIQREFLWSKMKNWVKSGMQELKVLK